MCKARPLEDWTTISSQNCWNSGVVEALSDIRVQALQ